MKNGENKRNREKMGENLIFQFQPTKWILEFSKVYSIYNSCDLQKIFYYFCQFSATISKSFVTCDICENESMNQNL